MITVNENGVDTFVSELSLSFRMKFNEGNFHNTTIAYQYFIDKLFKNGECYLYGEFNKNGYHTSQSIEISVDKISSTNSFINRTSLFLQSETYAKGDEFPWPNIKKEHLRSVADMQSFLHSWTDREKNNRFYNHYHWLESEISRQTIGKARNLFLKNNFSEGWDSNFFYQQESINIIVSMLDRIGISIYFVRNKNNHEDILFTSSLENSIEYLTFNDICNSFYANKKLDEITKIYDVSDLITMIYDDLEYKTNPCEEIDICHVRPKPSRVSI